MSESISLLEEHIDTALSHARKTKSGRKARVLKPRNIKAHIDRALELAEAASSLPREPIRTIHHFSCTGGTLFAKCIASMGNVLMLNEIDLHSSMPPVRKGKPDFTPTDMISLLRQGDPNLSSDLVTKLFLNDLQVLRHEQWKIGRSVVLRDHSHSHFLSGPKVSSEPTLKELVENSFPVKSILTVRDPIDSWLSMESRGWHKNIKPPTFDEYCRRYTLFLRKYRDVPILKYEDFVRQPKKTMREICNILTLDYFDGFEDVFSSFRFSGDSGRGGTQIRLHERRDHPDIEELKRTKSYQKLCAQLAYV